MRAFSILDSRFSIARGRLALAFGFWLLASGFVSISYAQSFFNSRGLGEITPAGDARIAALAEPSALSTLNPGILVNLNQTSFSLTALGAATLGNQSGSSRLLRDFRPATSASGSRPAGATACVARRACRSSSRSGRTCTRPRGS